MMNNLGVFSVAGTMKMTSNWAVIDRVLAEQTLDIDKQRRKYNYTFPQIDFERLLANANDFQETSYKLGTMDILKKWYKLLIAGEELPIS